MIAKSSVLWQHYPRFNSLHIPDLVNDSIFQVITYLPQLIYADPAVSRLPTSGVNVPRELLSPSPSPSLGVDSLCTTSELISRSFR